MFPTKYTHQTCLNASPEEVYKWHENPLALKKLTPEKDSVEIIKAAALQEGSVAHLRIPLLGCCLYVDWLAELENVKPNKEFSDLQISGPFKIWKHRHVFASVMHNKCEMREEIEFIVPGGRIVHSVISPIVLNRLKRVFRHRHQVLIDEFGQIQPELLVEAPHYN